MVRGCVHMSGKFLECVRCSFKYGSDNCRKYRFTLTTRVANDRTGIYKRGEVQLGGSSPKP